MTYLPRRENRAKRKAKAFKATNNSIGKHQSAMDAIETASLSGDPQLKETYWDGNTGSYSSVYTHVPPRSVNIVGSPEQKTNKYAREGKLTQGETMQYKAEHHLNRLLNDDRLFNEGNKENK
jgi:hypothetical protein